MPAWLTIAIFVAAPLAGLFVLGTCLGSLVNLAIYRLAWNRRSISPWSPPDAASPPRRWFDRIPVFGWLGLRRESALHGRGFWIRPMLLELSTGAGLVLLYWWEVLQYGLIPQVFHRAVPPLITPRFMQEYLAHALLIALLLVATWIDVDEKTIPDAITVPGTLLGLLFITFWPYALLPEVSFTNLNVFQPPQFNCVWLSTPIDCYPWVYPVWKGMAARMFALACFWAWCVALLPRTWHGRHGFRRAWTLMSARLCRERSTYYILALGLIGTAGIVAAWHAGGKHWTGLLSSLAGMALGGGMIWIIRVLGTAVLHREAMGFGDVTLLAMIGAFLGWQATVVVFFLAPFAGLALGTVQWLMRGETEIPYGPFLALGTVVTIVAWAPIWDTVFHIRDICQLGWYLPAILFACLAMIVVLLPIVRWLMAKVRTAS